MTNLKKQIFSVMTAGALVLSVSAPAFAGTTLEISGNGAGSNNYVGVSQTNTTTVTQSNDAHVDNNVTSNAKTGGNDASFNTGGNTNVNTGAATTDTTVTNAVNSNAAQVGCGGCQSGNVDVTISNNGADSQNTVGSQQPLTVTNTTSVGQKNYADVHNNVESNAKTGGNDANSNTGGNVTVNTGAAGTTTNVSTSANANNAVVGNGNGASNPTATFMIKGNGADSINNINAKLAQSATISQDNDAYINNNVESNAKTGGNDANYNTGGNVTVHTGPATVTVGVDNMANFNNASLDCGCGFDVLAKIAGNGSGSERGSLNNIFANLSNTQRIGQDNYGYLHNWLDDQNAFTGWNDANSNTGATTDPSVVTGAANAGVTVSNSANMNTVGSVLPVNWPFGNVNLGANFDMTALLAFFGIHIS